MPAAGLSPGLSPGLAAERLAALPGRLRRRAETLEVGDPVDGPAGPAVTVGAETVTLADLTCTCLLSPRCAHVGAVCLTVTSDGSDGSDGSDRPDTSDTGRPVEPASSPASATREVVLDRDAVELVDVVTDGLAEVLRYGLTDLPLHHAVALEASLQRVRVARLHRLERALTGVVAAATDLREGRPVNRASVTDSVTGVLLTCHLLRRGDADAVGTARRVYGDLGSATLVPVGAEPVVTASGFAGASVILAGQVPEAGSRYTLGRTPPGDRADVPRIWHGPAGIGDVRASLSELARHKVLVSGATVSADGRLGSGKAVRAALGAPLTVDDVREAVSGPSETVPTVLTVPTVPTGLTGTVLSVSRKGVELDCDGMAGSARFSRAARACGVDGLVTKLQGAQESATPVTVVTSSGEAVAVWFGDEVIYPGLDRVKGQGVPDGAPVADDAPVAPLAVPAGPTPAGRITEWLELLVFGGRRVLDSATRQRDAAWCERNGAPLAGELLRGLTAESVTDSSTGPASVLPLVVYGTG